MKKSWVLILGLMLGASNGARATLYSVGYDKNQFTSDFMIGNVIVSVIFPESNGAVDPNQENWSEARQAQVLNGILSGLNWWTQQNNKSPLQFTVVSRTLSTKYEPITRPYYHESLWIPDLLGNLGYSGTRFSATRDYVNDLRVEYDADWGFVIFVVDSANDINGKLADGFFAYAYLGGPFLVMTYDNGGYGIGNMNVVTAHETGHIFHALDQYAGASSPYDYSIGYMSTINGNHAWSSTANNPNSIMRGGLRWGMDDWTRRMIGWFDDNNNNRDDIVDKEATVQSVQEIKSESSPGTQFSGQANVQVLPRQGNASGYGLTLDTIAGVQYRLPGGEWGDASPVDGTFDGPEEDFQISIPVSQIQAKTVSAQSLEVRALTAFEVVTGSAGGGGGGGSTSLDNAHAYPNPYKPNSGIGHGTQITFTNLTPNAKLQVFTVAGEPVFDQTTDASGTDIAWNVVNDDGDTLASGVYYYLITDSSGGQKTGKLAVIR